MSDFTPFQILIFAAGAFLFFGVLYELGRISLRLRRIEILLQEAAREADRIICDRRAD
jgi:hypothetical protein